MAGKLNRTCKNCGNDEWWSIDNPPEYTEFCSKCLTSVTFYKNELIEEFTCPNCNSTNIKPEENENELIACCSDCGTKTVVLEKHYVEISNLHKKPMNEREKREFYDAIDELNGAKCPRCGSKNFSTGARGFSVLTGFIGSNKTVNRCAVCGHQWKPKR